MRDRLAGAHRAGADALHGMNRDAWKRYSAEGSWYYEVVAPGCYNMTDIQAAIGLVQLERRGNAARRRQIVAQYQAAFSQIEALQTPVERAGVDHAWHLYVLRLNLDRLKIDRARFIEELKARNIGTSVHFYPHPPAPVLRGEVWLAAGEYVAYREYQQVLSLHR